MANNRTGAVDEHAAGNMATAQQQAASIGATIGPDGWWYKNGQRLSHDQADALVNAAGTGTSGNAEWGKTGFLDRNPWLRTVAPIWAGASGAYTTHDLTKPGGGMSALVHDPLEQAAAGVLGGVAGTAATRAATSALPRLAGSAPTNPAGTTPIGPAPKGGLPGILSGVGDFLTGNGGLNAGLTGIAALRGSQSTDYARGALQTAQDAYNAKAPLREEGIAGMLNPGANTPDLSGLAAIRSAGNPFDRVGPVVAPQGPGAARPNAPGYVPPQNIGTGTGDLAGLGIRPAPTNGGPTARGY
jgi:hypothetical protein